MRLKNVLINKKKNIMKKIVGVLFMLTLGTIFYFWYQNSKSEYISRFNKVDLLRQGIHLKISWFSSFFSNSDYNLHDQIISMIPEGFVTHSSVKSFVEYSYRDELNDNGSIFLYVPLYSRQTKKKESFVLISAGIDGKLNAKYTVGDTIYDDEYLNKFNFYNIEEYAERKSVKFNLGSYLFGNKDYLVRYYNCVNDSYNTPMTMEYEKYRMHSKRIKESISLIATFEKDTLINNQNSIILKSWTDGYRAYCKMHKPTQKKNVKGDTLIISGFLEKMDNNGSFCITHCVRKHPENSSLSEILDFSKLDKRQLMKRKEILNME